MTKKLHIKTWGCQMNEYDSSKMADLLDATHGYQLTDVAEEADVLLLNTCSIREKAQEKVFSQLGRWRKLKEKRPDLLIGVGGCVASQEGAQLLKRAPYVDIIFGPQTLHRVPEMLQRNQEQHRRIAVVDVSFPAIEKFDVLPEPRIQGHKAFVSIMEGCSKYCSFCVVPYTRGEEVSRPLDDVIAEVAHALAQGAREITLIGQNVNAYRGQDHQGRPVGFAELLHYLASMPQLVWLRFTTSHPLEFDNALLDAFRHLPQLVAQLHLPVQSGSDRILQQMKRNHDREWYLQRIRALRDIRPELHLSSDFIVGFPGETDDDFQDTLRLVDDADMDFSYSFLYSPRPGTPAADLIDNVPLPIKKQRLDQLQSKLAQSARRKTNAMVGTRQQVMIEGVSTHFTTAILGNTFNNRLVHIPCEPTWLTEPLPTGQLISVNITEAISTNALIGQLLIVS